MSGQGLKFTFIIEADSEEEIQEYMKATQSFRKAIYCLHEIKNDVRGIWKHGDMSEDAYNEVDRIYQQINQRIVDADLDEELL